jgi:hypothetical protein
MSESDPVAMLLKMLDRPATPRPEFAAALREQLLTADEVGRAFKVACERIRHIENQSLKKLRTLDPADSPDEPEAEGGRPRP